MPYERFCFDAAYNTPGNTNLVPCVHSYGQTKGAPITGAIPADFTPVSLVRLSAQQSAAHVAASTLRCKQPLIETWHNGKRQVMCPIATADSRRINCGNALRTVWQCDRFKAAGQLDNYNKCMALANCFQYDVQLPDGTTVPVAVKATDTCMAAAAAALEQCAPECVPGLRATCSARAPWHKPAF